VDLRQWRKQAHGRKDRTDTSCLSGPACWLSAARPSTQPTADTNTETTRVKVKLVRRHDVDSCPCVRPGRRRLANGEKRTANGDPRRSADSRQWTAGAALLRTASPGFRLLRSLPASARWANDQALSGPRRRAGSVEAPHDAVHDAIVLPSQTTALLCRPIFASFLSRESPVLEALWTPVCSAPVCPQVLHASPSLPRS